MPQQMDIKSQLRRFIPNVFWQTAGFCTRLPVYWRLDRSEHLRVRQRVEGLPLFVTPNACVFIPESVTAYMNWRSSAIECPDSSIEARDFLRLAEGRDSFFDVGAQTGFMSALFACSRKGLARLVSVEPDPQVECMLNRARELNMRSGVDWLICTEALSDCEGRFEMPICNYLRESMEVRPSSVRYASVRSRSLGSLIDQLGWKPDVIKIDVESYEYEILNSSMDVIAELKPALQVEVHWKILEDRKLDPDDFLVPLRQLGYRGIRSKYRDLPQWNRARSRETVSRMSLVNG